jgi:phage host-nuclease inhibitor protein Gam
MSLDGRFVEQARRDLTALLAAHPELEEDEVLRMDMAEGQTNAMEMLDELIRVERDARSLQDAIADEMDRLNKRLQRFVDRQRLVRKYMMQLMDAAGLKKVERPAATVSIAAGRPKVVITDETLLGEKFVRIKREPNKEAILKALLSHENGVFGATLSNSEPTIRIS